MIPQAFIDSAIERLIIYSPTIMLDYLCDFMLHRAEHAAQADRLGPVPALQALFVEFRSRRIAVRVSHNIGRDIQPAETLHCFGDKLFDIILHRGISVQEPRIRAILPQPRRRFYARSFVDIGNHHTGASPGKSLRPRRPNTRRHQRNAYTSPIARAVPHGRERRTMLSRKFLNDEVFCLPLEAESPNRSLGRTRHAGLRDPAEILAHSTRHDRT